MKILLGLVVVLVAPHLNARSLTDDGHLTNQFAVILDGEEDVAELVATAHGFNKIRKLTNLENAFVFSHPDVARRSKRSADDIIDRLREDPNVKFAEQQELLTRVKRVIVHDKQLELPIQEHHDPASFRRFFRGENGLIARDQIPGGTLDDMDFIDPYYSDQWYYNNYGQTGGKRNMDLNVIPAWKKGFTGKDVVVVVLDDGIEHTHPDLRDNYYAEVSADFNDPKDDDPMPNEENPDNSHGTRCAGEIAAAANNTVCGVGIAYEARIGGVRILDGPITDSLEAEAVVHMMDKVDIYSASWGPTDDGKTLEGPKKMCQKALKKGAEEGRGGKGNIYSWATGNGGMYNDSCSCDGYVSSPYTLAVGSINDQGLSTYYSEVCPATMAVVFTGGSHGLPGEAQYRNPTVKVVTTDIKGDCTLDFEGTSSAAPLAAGCFALVLQANPDITWRDIQHIVVRTARIPNDKETGWTMNGAGFHVNPKFGFGALDCSMMVEEAQQWETVPHHHICTLPEDTSTVEVPNYGSAVIKVHVPRGCSGAEPVNFLEHTQVKLHLRAKVRGKVTIILTSPLGTRSEILAPRPRDTSDNGIDFTFMTVHNWGENPAGEWNLTIADASKPDDLHANNIVVESSQLILWGTDEEPQGRKDSKTTSHSQHTAHIPNNKEVKTIMTEENQAANDIDISSADDTNDKNRKVSDKSFNEVNDKITEADLNELVDLLKKDKHSYSNGDLNGYHQYEKRNFHKNTYEERQPFSEDTFVKSQPKLRSYNDKIRYLLSAIEEVLDEETM